MSVWKIKYVVYIHYLPERGEISMEREEPFTSEVAHIWAELAILGGSFVRAEILGAVLAPLNSNVAPVFSKLALHMVQFGPYNWVVHFNGAELTPSQYQTGLTRFGPIFWAKSTTHFTVRKLN